MNRLIKELGRTIASHKNPEIVTTLLQQTQINTHDYQKWVQLDKTNYKRVVIHRENEFELVLLTWGPHQYSTKHSHQSDNGVHSHCWFKLLNGNLTENIFYNNNKMTLQIHNPGIVNYLHDSIGEHEISNDCNNIAISLHCYSPPLIDRE